MTEDRTALALRAQELREQFDRRFAEPFASLDEETYDMLAIRVGGRSYVVPLRDVAGVHVNRVIVPLPTHVPELLGLCAIRGATVPVYDLASLLGHAPATAPRPIVLVAASDAVALAFDGVDGQLRVTPAQIATARQPAARATDAVADSDRHAVCVAEIVRPIIHLASVVEAIARRAQPPKEP
jgi:purine-binding chemotaxis protein CheW